MGSRGAPTSAGVTKPDWRTHRLGSTPKSAASALPSFREVRTGAAEGVIPALLIGALSGASPFVPADGGGRLPPGGRRVGDAAAAAAAASPAVGHRRARSIGLQQHRLVPRSTRFPRAMAVAGSCPSGAQAVREVDLLRAAQSGAMCGDNQLVRTAAADWSARCPAATPVPNHAAWQARRSHVDRRLGAPQRWTISCALTALSSQGAAACPSADFGHLHC